MISEFAPLVTVWRETAANVRLDTNDTPTHYLYLGVYDNRWREGRINKARK
jgi:hypothetical protein